MKNLFLRMAFAAFFISSSFAQFDTGSVLGSIRDKSGALVPGATVTLTNLDTGITVTRNSNETGEYEFLAVHAGHYKVAAEKAGFAEAMAGDVVVTVNARQRVDLTLNIARTTESVEISAAPPLVETDSSQRGQIISKTQAVELPLNGREYSQLVLLTTGVRQSAVGTGSISTNREGSFNVNGLRSTFNNYLLDGLDNNAYGTSNQGFSNQVIQPSPDALAEFQVVTNNESAEYGRAGGATINVAYASGTNKLHGTAYEFLRNTDLNGAGFFKSPDGRTPQFNRNQFGATLGGAIVKQKAFFFLDYEGFRQIRGIVTPSTIATPAERSGIFPIDVFNPFTGTLYKAGTQIPTSAMSPFAQKVLAGLPLPTNTGLANNYVITERFTNNTDKYDAKFDYQLNQDMSSFLRLSQRKANLVDNPPIPLPSGGAGNGNTRVLNQQLASGWTWTRTANQLIEARLGISYTKGEKFPLALGSSSAQTLFGIPGLPTDPQITGGLPTELISGFSDLGRQATNPQWQYPLVINPKLNYSLLRGNHSIKTGYEYQWIGTTVEDVNPLYGRDAYAGAFSRFQTGVKGSAQANCPAPFTTATCTPIYDLVDFLWGARSQFALSTFFITHLRQQQHYAYIQDDWKVNNRLTLNLGLRYEYATPYYEKDNHLTNFDPTTDTIISATDNGIAGRALVNPERNDFAPRLGFAYTPLKSTVVRGGYGISYIHYNRAGAGNLLPINGPQVINAVVNQTAPRLSSFLTSDQGYPAGLTSPVNFNPLTANITYVPKDYHTSYVQSWFFSIQRELAKNTLLDVAYVGNHASKLLLFANFNQAHPFTTGTLASNRPIPSFGDITYAFNGGDANYHSLQVRFERRMSGGLTFLNSFTYSHAIDNGSGSLEDPNGNFPAPQDFYNQKAERATSAYDQPFTNTTSLVYQLPFGRNRRFLNSLPVGAEQALGGWEISTINQASSGQPVTITYSPAASLLVSGIQQDFRGANNYRPNVIGNPILAGGGPKNGLPFLNAAAFQLPNGTPFGDASRNIARAPNFNQLDFAANKSFQLPFESTRLQFRAEFFNLLNHTNFLPPNSNFSSGAAFGKITQAFDARQIQFGLKLSF
ncbi:MAG TPA: TonB-dependent receptor [Candidatus Angelobacter sp.]|nr:TonB-dependent receptor [Candidatus Angelobacter sp.]